MTFLESLALWPARGRHLLMRCCVGVFTDCYAMRASAWRGEEPSAVSALPALSLCACLGGTQGQKHAHHLPSQTPRLRERRALPRPYSPQAGNLMLASLAMGVSTLPPVTHLT